MNPLRNGNFTSSEIVALTKRNKAGNDFGVPAQTYIMETNMERRLGRCLTDEVTSRATSWGKLLEKRVHDLLGIDYKLCSSETIGHPDIDFWCGSPDFIRYFEDETQNTVCDSKCPLTLKSFCQLVDGWTTDGMDGIRELHKDGEKFYWQLTSNGVLTRCNYGELIVYAPYQSELEAIRDMAMMYDGPDQNQYKWIAYAHDDELPYLIEGGYYKNINKFRFPIPQEDKAHLTKLVLEAGEFLIERKEEVEA